MAKTYKRRHAKTRRTRKHKTRKYNGGKPTTVRSRSKSRSPPKYPAAPAYRSKSPSPSPPKYKPAANYPSIFPKMIPGSKPANNAIDDQAVSISLKLNKQIKTNYVYNPHNQMIYIKKNRNFYPTGKTFTEGMQAFLAGEYNEGEDVLPFEHGSDEDVKMIDLKREGNHLVKV
jgi:hypothetical protein